MKKTVFVIGANSVVGSQVVAILSKTNKIITAGLKGCDVFCDVSKQVKIPNGIDIVINFAAAFGGDSPVAIKETIETNVLGTLNICTAAKKAGAKQLILISSIFALLDESSPFYNIYSITKKQADELANFFFKDSDIKLTILRPSQIYGDSDDFARNQPFFYKLIDQAQAGQDITIYGKNDAKRNYINCLDVGEIISRVIISQTEGIFNCAYPDDVSYSEVARAAQKAFKKGGQVKFVDDKADIPDNIFKKDSSLYRQLNFSPAISIAEGIARIKRFREES